MMDQHDHRTLVRPSIKVFGNIVAAFIFIVLIPTIWLKEPKNGANVSLSFKPFWSYYFLASWSFIIFISFRYKVDKHGLFMLHLCRFGGGLGIFLFPFLWPLCVFPNLPVLIARKPGLISDPIAQNHSELVALTRYIGEHATTLSALKPMGEIVLGDARHVATSESGAYVAPDEIVLVTGVKNRILLVRRPDAATE